MARQQVTTQVIAVCEEEKSRCVTGYNAPCFFVTVSFEVHCMLSLPTISINSNSGSRKRECEWVVEERMRMRKCLDEVEEKEDELVIEEAKEKETEDN